ncbi:MAG: CPXCG motif-containing cysteine-rich protein [Verrucomicrobiales bacterium]
MQCPACFEWIEVTIDLSEGSHERIEDCQVCCRPMELQVRCEGGEVLSVEAVAA